MLPLILAFSCNEATPDSAADTAPEPAAPGILDRDAGWLRGDLHVHTTYDGGFEDVATVVALAEYLADPTFLAAHPEFEGDHLDFLSITDHRTVEQQSDPGYASDRLVLVGGEEFGSDGHAGAHGIHERVDHDPDGDGTTLEDLVAAIEHTHDQGGTFSPNHPFLPDIAWPWDTTTHDGVEVWNAGWALMAPDYTQDTLDAWELAHGTEASATFRRAVQAAGSGSAMQALAWYEAQLMVGRHLAVIGGSDRHAVLLPGFPTTYVRTDTADEAGVVAGLRARHTFVARTPASAQLLVTGDGWELGDEVSLAGATSVDLTVRVARAEGGLLRIIGGGPATEAELADAELGAVLVEQAIDSDDFSLELTLEVGQGSWFYPLVLEPLLPEGTTDEQAEIVRSIAVGAAATGEEDFVGLAELAAAFVDPDVLFDASTCDPDDWLPDQLQCFPPDDEGLASFYVPDLLDRGLNALIEDGQPTDWCMGAIGSATRFVR